MARIEKINAQVKREISSMLLLGDIKDPRLKFVTITEADVTKDLRQARVKFSVLDTSAKNIERVQEGLDSARGIVRRLIGERVRMRYTPEINFIYDRTLEFSDKIDRTLAEIKKDQTNKS